MNFLNDVGAKLSKFVNKATLLGFFILFATVFSGTVQAAKPGDRVGDWFYNCDADSNAGKGICYISQTLQRKQGTRQLRLMTANIGRLFKDKKIWLVTLLPLDAWRVDVQSPVTIDVDKKKSVAGKIDTCFVEACRARFVLNRKAVSSIMRGTAAGVSFKLITGKPVRIELSLKGITNALGNL